MLISDPVRIQTLALAGMKVSGMRNPPSPAVSVRIVSITPRGCFLIRFLEKISLSDALRGEGFLSRVSLGHQLLN